jgi:serine/threonine protein kinase
VFCAFEQNFRKKTISGRSEFYYYICLVCGALCVLPSVAMSSSENDDIIISGYTIVSKLGKGGFGEVFLGVSNKTGREVCFLLAC